MIKKLLFLTLILISNLSWAQRHQTCGTDHAHNELLENNTSYAQRYARTKQFLAEKQIKHYKTVTTTNGTEFHVPVVIHVMHTGGAIGTNYNPSDTKIHALVAQLNKGFGNTYDNPAIAGSFNSVNIPIRFYLAQRNETNCAATTGINRVDLSANTTYINSGVQNGTGQPGITDAALKGAAHWNELNYYNIYIVNKINAQDGYTSTTSFITGYAFFPVLGGFDQDGMVCLAYVAADSTATTFIHELGHAFNLYHPFQGGSETVCPSNANCASDNDGVCDTEPIRLSYACNPTGNNPCTNAPYTGTQWNYMGYFTCDDRFSAGQSSRMMDALINVRTSYKNSAGIDPPPTALPISITPPTINPSNATNNADVGPEKVEFNTIEHTSKGFSFEGSGYLVYVDNTCNQATTLLVGGSYPLSVTTFSNTQKAVAYIDYDNSGTFAATEQVLYSTGVGGTQVHTAMVTIPSMAILNTPLRMRVLTDFGTNPTINPVGQLNYGQAEDYTITILGAALPVVWRSISANLNHRQHIDVRWATEMENNSSLFEIEKSKDGANFYKIGELAAAQNSALPTYYNFEDTENLNGHNYYRIKQIDMDNQISYSEVATEIIGSKETNIVIFPNPANETLHINLSGLTMPINQIRYSIMDLNGRKWLSNSAVVTNTNYNLTQSLNSVPAGMYFIQISINDMIYTQKIVKE